jgi:hypothetical protein
MRSNREHVTAFSSLMDFPFPAIWLQPNDFPASGFTDCAVRLSIRLVLGVEEKPA